jgi:hypothetical protein
MQAARRWGVIWPAALAGLVSNAAAGFVAAPDVIAVPALCALSGMALGLLLGLLAVWRRASEPGAPAVAVDRHVAEESPSWPLAPPPAGGDPAPGWYPGTATQRRPALLGRRRLDRAPVARPAAGTRAGEVLKCRERDRRDPPRRTLGNPPPGGIGTEAPVARAPQVPGPGIFV